jgi:hypothetical protein
VSNQREVAPPVAEFARIQAWSTAQRGIQALRVHAGPPTAVAIKDIRLKRCEAHAATPPGEE